MIRGLDPEALAVLAATPRLMRTVVDSLPGEVFASGDYSGGWKPRQVLEHLIDTEGIAFRQRIGRIVSEDKPAISPIDPPARLEEGDYAERSLDDLLSTFESLRAESLAWLQGFDGASLARTGEHEVAGTISAGELVSYWATHDLVHLRQLARALQDRFLPRIGNMAAFLED